jgi:hypothetical protein
MAVTQNILTVVVHVDDDTGMYYVGEMDYRVPSTTKKWLEEVDNRDKLAQWLEHLADSCRCSRPPFGENYPESHGCSEQIESKI